MGFVETIETGTVVLTEGSVVERIRRESGVTLDPNVANAALVREPTGRTLLRRIYREYLDVAREYARPMIVLAPTWRANPERVRRAGLGDGDVLIRECVDLVSSIRDDYNDIKDDIFIGGLLACKNDAYRAADALNEDDAMEFHQQQAYALASSGVDFILASTLPARCEAIGIARALAAAGIPYVLSFIIRANGTLLDGNPLGETLDIIDSKTPTPPYCYMVNCVHPSVCERALQSPAAEAKSTWNRVRGLQANTSLKSPEELDGLECLDAEEPEAFARAMLRVQSRVQLTILGGCCGTDERHIRAIAEGLRRHHL
jgi:homocysteine S-methyltransferase